MSENFYEELKWLPRSPDFTEKCRGLISDKHNLGERLREIAGYYLSENQLSRLCKTVEKLKDANCDLHPLTPFKLGIIGNVTTHFIVPSLISTALRYGIILECIEGNYDQALQESVDPLSAINTFQPDAVLIVNDYRGFFLQTSQEDVHGSQQAIDTALNLISNIRNGIKNNSNAICIFQSIPPPVETIFGSFDVLLPGTMHSIVAEFNRELAKFVQKNDDILFDVSGLAQTVGLSQWHNPKLWNIAKLPFDSLYLPIYSDHACRLLGALRGKSRRCLILDLDNTVWGGVIGDDGIEGITIGQGNPTGEAYLSLQSTALSLRNRGVVLAVSSKNTDEIARIPFKKHPDMLLKEEHIAVFQANWNDKATNIKAISEELNLGLDSFVFLDDNPVERGLVRKLLPQVAVPELPDDPALYSRTLLAGGYFEAINFLDEDRKRAAYYSDNARRVALKNQAGGVDAYLHSLHMVMAIQPFDVVGRSRISQLINKSNQYNLTTHRYSESDIQDIESDPNTFHMQVRLSDAFGDNGMISVVICREIDTVWEIDTWLMSCRVLGRKVEFAVLNEIVQAAVSRGVNNIIGVYIPTERNALVKDHYDKLGFKKISCDDSCVSRYTLNVDDHIKQDLPIEIIRSGFGNI